MVPEDQRAQIGVARSKAPSVERPFQAAEPAWMDCRRSRNQPASQRWLNAILGFNSASVRTDGRMAIRFGPFDPHELPSRMRVWQQEGRESVREKVKEIQ